MNDVSAIPEVVALPIWQAHDPFMGWQERASARMRAVGISREDLAERLGVTAGAVGHWFTETRTPPLARLVEMARVLQMPLVELIDPEVVVADRQSERALLGAFRRLTGEQQALVLRMLQGLLDHNTTDSIDKVG